MYQRWIYRIDPKRVNEFGTSGDMMENDTTATDQSLQNGAAAAIEGVKPSPEQATAAKLSLDKAAAAKLSPDQSAANKTSPPRHKSKAAKKRD